MMIKHLLAAFCLTFSACAEDAVKAEGSSKDIRWGQSWAGPELKAPAALKGKVTLLVIWGG